LYPTDMSFQIPPFQCSSGGYTVVFATHSASFWIRRVYPQLSPTDSILVYPTITKNCMVKHYALKTYEGIEI
jgi:hypothetical protein